MLAKLSIDLTQAHLVRRVRYNLLLSMLSNEKKKADL